MFGFIKKMFIGLLTSAVNAYIHNKLLSLNIQQCMIQPTLINLHPNDALKSYVTIQLRLILIDVLEVVILLMIYLIEHVFQTKHKI